MYSRNYGQKESQESKQIEIRGRIVKGVKEKNVYEEEHLEKGTGFPKKGG